MDYLVPEMQSYHLDMGSVSGAGEISAGSHFLELYGGRGEVSCTAAVLLLLEEEWSGVGIAALGG